MAPLVAELLLRVKNPEQVMVLLLVVGLFAGLLQIAFGLLGGGTLIKYIPYPVVTGYLSGVAILIVLSQGPILLGLPKGMTLHPGLWTFSAWRWEAVSVGLATIALTLAGPRLTKKVPPTVLGIAGGVLTYIGLACFHPGLRVTAGNPLVIGPIGMNTAGFGSWTTRWSEAASLGLVEIHKLLLPALTLSILLSIDTLKTCVVLDAMTGTRHDSNRELIGQGLGNAISGLAGGMPGSGAMAPTVVNISSGGRGRASGLFSAAFVVATFLLLSRAVAWLPLSALAGMLVVLAARMFDWRGFHLLRQRATWFDFAVAAVVVATAVFVDLVLASGVGLALSILLFIRNMMHSNVVRRKVYGDEVTSHQRRLPEEAEVLAREGSKIAVFELQGSLFFGTADQLYTEVEPDFDRRRYFIFDMRRVLSVDFTAAHMLDMIENRLFEHGGRLLFANIPQTSPTGQDLSAYLRQLGLTDPARRAHLFPTLEDAFSWAEDRLLSKNLESAAPDTPLPLEEIDLLKGMDPAHLAALKACVSARTLSAGEMLFRQADESAGEMYLIRRGRVRIELDVASGGHRLIAVFARGDFFGEMAFVDHGRRAASACALAPTELFVVCRQRFDAAAARDPELGRKLFSRISKALALRLRQADAEIRALHEA